MRSSPVQKTPDRLPFVQRGPHATEAGGAEPRLIAALTLFACVVAAVAISWTSAALLPEETSDRRQWEETLPAPGSSPTALPSRSARPVEEPPSELRGLVPEAVAGLTAGPPAEDTGIAETLQALEATTVLFRDPEGRTLEHLLLRYPTAVEATQKRVEYTGALETVGYIVLGVSRSRTGSATHVAGENEIIVWSNGPLLAVLDGPPGVTREAFLRFPY